MLPRNRYGWRQREVATGSSRRKDSSPSSGGGAVILLLGLGVCALAWPYWVGTYLAVRMGADNPSTTRSVVGWVSKSYGLDSWPRCLSAGSSPSLGATARSPTSTLPGRTHPCVPLRYPACGCEQAPTTIHSIRRPYSQDHTFSHHQRHVHSSGPGNNGAGTLTLTGLLRSAWSSSPQMGKQSMSSRRW